MQYLFLRVFQDGKSISEVIFLIRGKCQGQIRGQRSNLLVQPLAFLRNALHSAVPALIALCSTATANYIKECLGSNWRC